jgi:hypothetical protein
VLDLLIAHVGELMAKDTDAKPGAGRTWHRIDHAVQGEAGNPIYSERVIERWLRNEARLLAKVYPVERITVSARYTGGGYHVSSTTAD